MVSFGSLALALLMARINAEPTSLRHTTSRRLSFESIAGYSPRSQVTDHNAIDLDQAAIEEQIAGETDESFGIARAIYQNGAHSKSFAKVTLATALTTTLSQGTKIEGLTSEGNQVVGKALKTFASGVSEIEIQYQTKDIQASYVDCQVGARPVPNLNGCFVESGILTISGAPYNYTYIPEEHNGNDRTIYGFSKQARAKMYDCENCPYVDYEKFYKYYEQFDYANQWVAAALTGSSTDFKHGNAAFSLYGFKGRGEAAKKGTAYMNIWMYVIREFEDALDDCKNECVLCNDDPVHAWDEGVAFYTGSLEGQDGEGDGKLIYALADKRCKDFKTCGVGGDERKGTSKVNYDLLGEFALGQQNLLVGNCPEARVQKERIAQLMSVPLIQGTLRYAYIVDKQTSAEKEEAEGAVFAAAVLPIVHACSPKDAATIYSNMGVSSADTDFEAVKEAFENNYKCMGVTCADVGGVVNPADGEYYEGAGPCKDSSTSSGSTNTVGIVLGSIAGAVAVIAIAGIFFLRKREKSGKPVFAPTEGSPVA